MPSTLKEPNKWRMKDTLGGDWCCGDGAWRRKLKISEQNQVTSSLLWIMGLPLVSIIYSFVDFLFFFTSSEWQILFFCLHFVLPIEMLSLFVRFLVYALTNTHYNRVVIDRKMCGLILSFFNVENLPSWDLFYLAQW